MKTVTAALLAVAVATVIGSVHANAAEPSSTISGQPVVGNVAATTLPSMHTGYHFAVLSRVQFYPSFGRQAEMNPPHDDVSVGLVRDSDGQIVRGVEIDDLAFDMSPDGMGDMGARINFDGRFSGAYRLKLYPTMAGDWAIHLSGRMPDKLTPVQGTVTVAVTR